MTTRILVLLIVSTTFAKAVVEFSHLKETVLGALRSAESFVYVSSYSVSDPDVLRLLSSLSYDGVEVKVMVERPVLGDFEVRVDANDRSLFHAKFLVVDGEISIVGSANLTPSGLEMERNDLIVFDDPEIADFFERLFSSIWNGEVPSGVYRSRYGEFLVGPFSDLERRVLEVLSEARRSVDIAMFAFSDMNVFALLKYLSSKGVRIRMVLDDWCLENRSVARFPMDQFEVVFLKDVHHKFAIVDGEILITGSANMSESGYHRNFEVLFVSDYEDLVGRYEEYFESIWR